MNKISLLLGLTLLSACATGDIVQVEGLNRVSIKQYNYSIAQFYVKNYTPKKVNRKIASNYSNEFTRLKLKKVYFLSLWQQQQTFAQILGKEVSNFCPQFHNDLIKYDRNVKGIESAFDYKQNFEVLKENPQRVVYYPVMSLPYKGVDLYSYISSKNDWENVNTHVEQAMKNHYSKNEEEIQSLCLTGVSDGLYIYQNLATYYSTDNKFINSKQALHSILKVAPVSNMLILNSFVKSEFHGTWTPVQLAVLEKLNVEWFKNYLYEMSSVRNNTFSSYALKE